MILDRCPNLKPWELDQLTLSEICWILDFGGGPRPFGGRGQAQSYEEMLADLHAYARLPAKEKLDRKLRRIGYHRG